MDPARAIEENGAELLLVLGRAAGAEERDDGRVSWVIGNCPIDYHNAVVRADLSPEEADREIEASLERMRAHGVPGSWHVGPSMRPSDLAERLTARGFEYGGDDIGMAADLSALPEEVPTPDGFAVERVRDEEDLAVCKVEDRSKQHQGRAPDGPLVKEPKASLTQATGYLHRPAGAAVRPIHIPPESRLRLYLTMIVI